MKRSKIFSDCCNSLQWFLMSGNNNKNKRRLSAEGCSLLPSALRPRLLGQKFTKNTQFWAILALFQIVAASTIFSYLCSTPASAASLTLTIPSKFSLDVTPGAGGVFSKSEPGNINVKTDNSSGYTLSIKAKNSDNSNSLINSSNSINNKLNSISESTTEDLFKSDSRFNNSWGYLPSKFNSEDNTNFLPGPTTEESILEATEEANNETGADYNISIGAKVDNDISSGTYTNTFIFSALVNEVPDGVMQDWAADENNCKNLPIEQTINLLDTRDNNIYKVAKLKDGKCWMIENLRLGDDKLQNRTLTSNDTDITETYQLTEQTAVDFNANKNYDADALYIDPNHPEYGGYYSWHTATAGTGTWLMDSHGRNVTSSICPKGWKLPTGGSSSDFNDLVTAYGGNNSTGSTNLRATPVPGFVYSGNVSNSGSGLAVQGSLGHYWSSTVNGAGYAHNLGLGSGGADPADYSLEYVGYSVRCVYYPPKKITDLQYLQDWGDLSEEERNQVIDSMQDETNYTLKDKRDDNEYTIAKLKNGKVWMTQGLRIVNKTIDSTESDMTSGSFTIPASSPEGSESGFVSDDNNNDAAYYNNNQDDGAYYTWHTATAGTGTASTAANVDATSSICPKGWKLPKGGAEGSATSDFVTLAKAYGGTGNNGSGQMTAVTNLIASPVPHFTYAGYVDYSSGALYYHGSYGYYWSRTDYGTANAYFLGFGSGGLLNPANNNTKRFGQSVRCVYYPPKKITDLQYMQDWGDLSKTEKAQVIDSMLIKTNYTLTDKRDNSEYTIARLGGKVWMTQNLRLGDSKLSDRTLTSNDTDITETYQLTEQTAVDFNANKNYDADALYIDPNHPEYGGYYSWHTATAGTGTRSMSTYRENATSSICPKGWKLPTGGSSSDFNDLVTAYGGNNSTGSTNLRATPVPGFVYSGAVWNNGDGLARQGSDGYYWSSTVYNANNAYALSLYSSSASPANNSSSKYYGYSVRCVDAP